MEMLESLVLFFVPVVVIQFIQQLLIPSLRQTIRDTRTR